MGASVKAWIDNVIKPEQIEKYLNKGKTFIDEEYIMTTLNNAKNPDRSYIKEIIAKSLELNRLEPEETAALLNCTDDDLWEEMFAAGGKIKQAVYGRRIVIFAPLYVSNHCVNNCVYCGFRNENNKTIRKQLAPDELRQEILALIRKGHKRLIMVYGEHPQSDVNFIAETLQIAYSTKEGNGEIRRCNVNAAPMSIEDLKLLRQVGIGTFQVFQETYHPETYRKLHPRGIKADYKWRLYALHRAMDAGVDDVGMGALFGLYDPKFEVMGLLLHIIDLETKFGGIGPHTISFPRIEPAHNTPFTHSLTNAVDDQLFKKIVTVIRLSVPYTGMILTARESPQIRQDIIPVGITQIDAGSNIGVGAYSSDTLDYERQQFILGDNRSLDETIQDLARMGYITSFCTADYRCGRTGHHFMDIAKCGKIHTLCIPNAILTFKEYLLDYASEETQKVGQKLIAQELEAIANPALRNKVAEMLTEIENGARDLYL
ncbi:MAG: [FeFe] hydrogenase H-cluster radical SAM maturase HydG [Syntrophomonadaceae bacterium]|nr:[FeFe] hydrogenase H-cluster radical SAM maturase HydG [Syntrophomonadaceae bacterium]